MFRKKMRKSFLNKIKCYLGKHSVNDYWHQTSPTHLRIFLGCKDCGKILSSRLEKIPNTDIDPFS
mgnify:CR=1 FL=1